MSLINPATGRSIKARALIDQGSQASLIRPSVCKELGVKAIPDRTCITGIGGAIAGTSDAVAMVEIAPRFASDWKHPVRAIIFNKLVEVEGVGAKERFFADLRLADPTTNESKVDILLGADVYPYIIRRGLMVKDSIVAQETTLGYTLSGVISDQKRCLTIQIGKDKEEAASVLDSKMRRFFEETKENQDHEDLEEKERLEQTFQNTTRRLEDGRYQVDIPFIQDPPKLGKSGAKAAARFQGLQKKLTRNEALRKEYEAFMNE